MMTIDLMKYRSEHLNMMIKLAFMLEEDRLVDALIGDEDDKGHDAAEPDRDLSLMSIAQQAIDREKKQEIRTLRGQKVRKSVSHLTIIFACMIVLLFISLSTALAVSPTLRSNIANILISFSSEKSEVVFTYQDDEIPMKVQSPPDWTGTLFPSFVPEGFTLEEVNGGLYALWQSEDGAQIIFNELPRDAVSVAGIKDAQVTTVQRDGGTYYMIVADPTAGDPNGCHVCDITSQMGESWFCLVTYYLDDETALRIADSVNFCK